MAVSLFGKFMIFAIIFKGVNALQVNMNSDITAAIGDTNIELTCQFTTENDDFVNQIYLTARNKTTDSFYRIVTFYPPHRNKEASLSTGGEYLSGRVSLTNPTSDTSAAIMSYKNPVQCEDDTDYRCDIHYDNNGQLETMQSDPTTITITSTVARQVQINGNITEKIGTNGTMLTCNFTLDQGDHLISVWMLATNMTLRDFENVAYFDPDFGSKLQPFGKVLFGNASLSSVNRSSKSVSLSFDDLHCKHSRLYKYKLIVKTKDNPSITIDSEAIGISIQVPPSTPDGIWLLNLQNNSAFVITDGDTVPFVCTGDVGKPHGKFIFQKYRRGHILPMNFTATSTSIREISDNCSYYRTSYITFQVTADDNKAVIRCAVVSPLTERSMYVESEPLHVYHAVRTPTIIKVPHQTDYSLGLDNWIVLTCTTDGNPKASYFWYKNNQFETIITNNTFTIEGVTKRNEGIYTCVVSNSFNNVSHTKRAHIYISILNEANDPQVNGHTAVVVVGTVCGLIILVLSVILFGVIQKKTKCLLMRNRNDRSLDYVNAIQQQDLSLYEPVGNVLDVHHYEQPSTREHQYTNTNLSGSVGHALDVHHYEQPSTGEHQYTNTNLSGN